MGSSASKAARAANTTIRKYPTRIPTPPLTSQALTTSTSRARPPLQSHRDDAINPEASDPHLDAVFNARLAQLGPVEAAPTLSNPSAFTFAGSRASPSASTSSTSQSHAHARSPSTSATQTRSVFPSGAANPAVQLLAARERLAKEAEEEFENLGRKNGKGRMFVDVVTVRAILMMRDDLGREEGDIEQNLGLSRGLVRKLGRKEVISGDGS